MGSLAGGWGLGGGLGDMREGLFHLSLNTVYKYASLLGIRRIKALHKPPQREPLRANAPDQYWHADVTLFRTKDNIRHYLHLVVDNYSRKILAWKLGEHLFASNTLAALGEAWENRTNASDTTHLIVDGGWENNNGIVDTFLNKPEISLQKFIALKDILQSNSMAEAANRTMKYAYLFRQPIANGDQLRKVIENARNHRLKTNKSDPCGIVRLR